MRAGIRSETLVIAKDSTGTLWATWTRGERRPNASTRSTPSTATTIWSPPAALPFPGAATSDDDISSIIAFTVSGQERIGVLWSNQAADRRTTSRGNRTGCVRRLDPRDGARPHTEQPEPGRRPHEPQDRLERQGLRRREDEQLGSSQPQELLVVRQPGGAWSATRSPGSATAPPGDHRARRPGRRAPRLHDRATQRQRRRHGRRRHLREDLADVLDLVPDWGGDGGHPRQRQPEHERRDLDEAERQRHDRDRRPRLQQQHQGLLASPGGRHAVDPPDAEFTGTPTSGQFPVPVTFDNTSTGTAPLTYAWNFDDPGSGASNTSTAKNPSHTYNAAGDYTVSLTVTNMAGSDVRTRTDYIHVTAPPPPVAAFSGAPGRAPRRWR